MKEGNKQTHYWTEPTKLKSKWTVTKIGFEVPPDTLNQVYEFNSKNDADSFLSSKNFYINGNLVHTS